MGGEPQRYWLVEKNDLYYTGRGRPWVAKDHLATFLDKLTAERIARRYGAVASENLGYDVRLKSFEDCGEPEPAQALAQAVRIAKADGWSIETLMLQAEKAYHNEDLRRLSSEA